MESYIYHKYSLDSRNATINCHAQQYLARKNFMFIGKCISNNKEAEKEANFIISATSWAYELPVCLGALIEIRRRKKQKREAVLINKSN